MSKEKINKIMLKEEKSDHSSHDVQAYINGSSGVSVDYYDLSPTAKSSYGGSDYEYIVSVDREYKDTLLLHLISEKFTDPQEFGMWCYEKGIEHDTWCWSGS